VRETVDKLKLAVLALKVPEWGQQSLPLWLCACCGCLAFH